VKHGFLLISERDCKFYFLLNSFNAAFRWYDHFRHATGCSALVIHVVVTCKMDSDPMEDSGWIRNRGQERVA